MVMRERLCFGEKDISMRRCLFVAVSMILCLAFFANVAYAETIKYYTGSYPDYRSWTWKSAAVRFTVPSDAYYQLDSLNMMLCGSPSATLLDVTVWADDSGSVGAPLYVLADQNWDGNDAWNMYNLTAPGLVFAPGSSFYAGYTSDAANYAEVGVFTDGDIDLGRSSGINIDFGPDWISTGGEMFFEVGVSPASVPEPLSLVFFGTGIAGVVGFVARRKLARKA
jgi:hypothetical protein